jgi:hypothetical protein
LYTIFESCLLKKRNIKYYLNYLYLTVCITVGLLLMTACGGSGDGGGGGGGGGDGGPNLTIVWEYDVTAYPNLTGFRFYNDADNSLLLDTFDLPSSIFDMTTYESYSQPTNLSIVIPVDDIVSYTNLGVDITKNMNVVMTAYVTLPNFTEIESIYSNVLTVQ